METKSTERVGVDVDSVMTASLVTVSSTTRLREAIRLIEDVEFRHLPVVDEGRLVGILSDRDLSRYRTRDAKAEPPTPESLEMLERPVSEIMTRPVISVDVTDGLGTVVDLMLRHRVGAVPALDPDTGGLMGIVSYVDVLQAVRPNLD
jgi:acetoin utilization protein AcuB